MSHAQQHVLACAIVLALVVVFGIHVFLFPIYSSSPTTRRIKISAYEQALCHANVRTSRTSIPAKFPCLKYGIVTTAQGGRLGNQIWEYASVWATARRTGLEPFMPNCILKTLAEHFENLSIPSLSYIGHCTLSVEHIVNSLSQWNNTDQNIIIPRHSAYWSLILIWLDDLRREFTFKASLRSHAQSTLRKAASSHNLTRPTYVGVHIRRSDYVGYLWRKLKAHPAPASFYTKAMDYFSNNYPNTVFLVVSDNIAWCKHNFRNHRHRISFVSDPSGRGAGKDLAILAACNHSIIDYGTYGSFGALLVTGETLVYNLTASFSTLIAEALPNWRVMS